MKQIKQFVNGTLPGKALLAPLATYLRSFYEPHIGAAWARARHRDDLKTELTLENAIASMRKRWPDMKSNADASPIFILASGWRSGSTLLQRLALSSGKALIWGEPYSPCGLIDGLSRPLRTVTEKYIPDDVFLTSERRANQDLTREWIANLYPAPDRLLDAHAAFLTNLFGKPALDLGYPRWGIKDVRLSIDHAIYLKWVFPNAKFLFLVRNPYDAYRSYRGRYWHFTWPHEAVYTPKHFGVIWKRLAAGFAADFYKANGIFVKYEQLVEDAASLEQIERYLELKMDGEILRSRIRGGTEKQAVPRREMRILEKSVQPVASALGYRPT